MSISSKNFIFSFPVDMSAKSAKKYTCKNKKTKILQTKKIFGTISNS